jgi:hypothetical protein
VYNSQHIEAISVEEVYYRTQTVNMKQALGGILCSPIFRPGGKKLLAKGHVISDEDARMLQAEGLAEVWVTEPEDEEIGEDEAVMDVATEIGCRSLEILVAAGVTRESVCY